MKRSWPDYKAFSFAFKPTPALPASHFAVSTPMIGRNPERAGFTYTPGRPYLSQNFESGVWLQGANREKE
jgi:hypothetical protein